MDITVTKKSLLSILSRCAGIASTKSTMPILANVHLDATDTALTVSASDLYQSVRGAIELVESKQPGSITLPCRELCERVKNLAEGPVRITADKPGSVTIRSVGTARKYTMHSLPGCDFPVLPEPKTVDLAFTVPTKALASLLCRTHFSVSDDETRPHLNSLCVELRTNAIRAVSTDGHRLTVAEVEVDGIVQRGDPEPTKMLVPHKAVVELRKLLESEPSTEVQLNQDGPNLFVQVGTIRLSSKLVDAAFPPYDQIIPKRTGDSPAVVCRATLLGAVKAVSIAGAQQTHGVKLTVGSGKVQIRSENAESGDGFDEVDADYTGPDRAIGFNARYIVDALSALDGDESGEEVSLSIGEELDPVVVRSGAGGDGYMAVVMPLRL